ncbi:MAG TPA: sigma 54-interacting transcriptional regulator [Polyangia bacterium]|jgi:transcriptional regulator with GAF, ATPase, and Fis domain/tetratricopeptide (TPR) repeat protein
MMLGANQVGKRRRDGAGGPAETIVSGRYRLRERLGAGWEGESFVAFDQVASQTVALKLFRATTTAVERRVRSEFERLAGLSHPGIVRVRDVGRHDGQLFLVTELVVGEPLMAIAALADDDQRRARLTAAAFGLADALAYLHGRGLVHGDLSPSNVRLDGEGRPILFDLAFPALESAGAAVGTLGFAAPEALIGQVDASTDLFSLGATLFAAWTGAGPFGSGLDAAARVLSHRAPLLSSTRPGLPAGWDELIEDLLHPSALDRPSSARQVLLRLGRLAGADAPTGFGDLLPPHPGGDPLAGIFVGRAVERKLLSDALALLGEGAAAHGVIALSGAEGTGRRQLIDQALRQQAIAQVAGRAEPVTLFRGSFAALVAWSETGEGEANASARSEESADPERDLQRRFARLAAALDRRAEPRPLCVVLDPGTSETGFAAFVAGAPPSGRLMLVVPTREPLRRIGTLDVSLGPLTAADVTLLASRAAGEELPGDVAARLCEATGGHAATTSHVVRQLVAAVRDGTLARFAPARSAGLEDRLAVSFAALPAHVRRRLASVALGVAPDEEADPAGTFDQARAAGWLRDGRPDAELASTAHRAVVMRALGEPDLRALAESAIHHLPEADERRGLCCEALGRLDDAAATFRRVARATLSTPMTAVWLERSFEIAPQALDVNERIRLADQLALEGRGGDAARVLASSSTSEETAPPSERLRLDERRAWLAARGGDLEAARRLLTPALSAPPTPATREATAAVRARLARVLVAMHRFEEAIAVAEAEAAIEDGTAGAVAVESTLLAHAYGGDIPAARALLAAPAAQALPVPRALYLTALIAHLGGDLANALTGYRGALSQADAAGDIHTAAAIALNLGALAGEGGRYGEALTALDRAIRELGRLGATAELGTALFNAGMLLSEIGDATGARRLIDRLRGELARRPGGSDAAAVYLEAELDRRSGNEAAALEAFAYLAVSQSTPRALARAAALTQIELLARTGRPDQAAALLERLAPAQPSDDAELRLVRARVLLATKSWDGDAALALAEALAGDARQAAQQGRRAAAWRQALTSARLFHRLGQGTLAAQSAAEARRLFEEVRMSTPIDHRPGIDQDPDARFFAELTRLGGGDTEATARAARNEGRLRRLLRINKRLNSELRLPRLLELIMDTVIELTEAERGFLLLEDDKGELAVKVARNIDQQTLEAGAFELSRSIARQAATGGGPIVTIDAAGDPRFREAMSVSDLHLRSVLAVPLQVKGRAAGTVYVDNRLRKGAFSDDDVQLVLDFAEQAAIAVENARLLSELRKRERQIEVLNRKLQGELDARKEELSGMKQELRENREALAIRYDYRNIVGRTPRMLDLFRLLDRLTDTALPVVIQGESGTGKELVARALHFNGPRRQQPFVSENCAAIPETLLESTLFGAVRGAFTGADHDSRGLFEVADGGTLFLDEVGEMSAAMQGKLLRILQTGELRRVGAERTRKVDVRIIAATNRDLGRMVEEGRFRQDLFFRLSVARILLPPLRERREDIPTITEHLLTKLTAAQKTAPKRIDAAAVARLSAYRWPGNVRELENEIMRALAFCRDSITVADLSPHIAGDGEAALTTLENPDSLTLKPRVERLERALVKEALSRSTGNQTKAAEALGLSRFGLQKKLRRYGMA